ncbi:hypothetical protein D3C71_1152470 [compost metagenome]
MVEGGAEGLVPGVIRNAEGRRHRQLPHAHQHRTGAAASHVPEAGRAFRVGNGDVDHRTKARTHRVQRHRQPARLGLEEMAIRRGLRDALGLAKARAFGKDHHAGRHQRELLAGASRRFLVLAAQGRVTTQLRLAVTLHEREVQRPPGQPDHRHVDQLLLQEELQERNPPVQRTLQHKDIHPRLVVAVDQVPVRVAQPGMALDIPRLLLDPFEPAGIAGNPRGCNAVEHRVDHSPDRCKGQYQLHQGDRQQQQAPEHRAGHQQNRAEHAGHPREAPARHRKPATAPHGLAGLVRADLSGIRRTRRAGRRFWKSHERQFAGTWKKLACAESSLPPPASSHDARRNIGLKRPLAPATRRDAAP